MTLRKHVPWWLRIAAKIILARLPVNYYLWKRLGLFEHGDMNHPARAFETYLTHVETAGLATDPQAVGKDFTVLELGPGDSIFNAIVARSLGAARIWLVDAGPFATTKPADYVAMTAYLQAKGYSVPIAQPIKSIEDVLAACNSTYLTEGVVSLRKIPDKSIDFCFSNAVLEHVPKRDFNGLALEMRRILKPYGVCVHRVDLKDHLGGGLNNLRFSDATWEGGLFSRSGFYTNRIRFYQMLGLFERAGFVCEVPRKIMWDHLPISRKVLATPFRKLADEELCISGFDLLLKLDRAT